MVFLIKRYPLVAAGVGIFWSIGVATPLAVLGVWDKFSDDKVPIWLAKRGWTVTAAILIYLGAVALLTILIVIVIRLLEKRLMAHEPGKKIEATGDLLDSVRLAEVRSEWNKLTAEQQRLVGRVLVSGGLSWNQIDTSYWKSLPVYSDWQLSDYLLERSTLLEHRSKGNADLRRYIQARKEGKTDFTLGRRTWKVKAEFMDALRQVVAEPVTALTDAQRNVENRIQPEHPELDITFDKTAPSQSLSPTKRQGTPDIEFTNPLVVDRWIHPEFGLVDEEPVPDFPFGSAESLEVQVMLARFYYKPDRDVPETIHVKAHIAIADASGKPIHARYDAVWDQEPESEYKTFDTAKTHGLIIALVSADAYPKSMGTFEYRERGGEFDPDSHRFEGTEFRLRLELIGKHYDQRVLYKAFDFGFGLVPKPWMKLI